jgi:Putative zinc-finger
MSSRIPDTHAEAWALLPFLANGRIEAADREWVDAHVATCAECRAELAAQRKVEAQMNRDGAAPAEAAEEQKSFNKLWARIEASESLTAITTSPVAGTSMPSRASRTVRWLAAAVVVQAVGLGVLGMSAMNRDDIVTVATPETQLDAPAVRIVFAPNASIDTVNTLLAHQELSIVSGPGIQGNFTAVLSPNAVASGASAESVAQVISKDPNVSFAQPVAR